jgi:hypothetical protein
LAGQKIYAGKQSIEVDNQRNTKTLWLDLYQSGRLPNYALAVAKEALFLDLQTLRPLTFLVSTANANNANGK